MLRPRALSPGRLRHPVLDCTLRRRTPPNFVNFASPPALSHRIYIIANPSPPPPPVHNRRAPVVTTFPSLLPVINITCWLYRAIADTGDHHRPITSGFRANFVYRFNTFSKMDKNYRCSSNTCLHKFSSTI